MRTNISTIAFLTFMIFGATLSGQYSTYVGMIASNIQGDVTSEDTGFNGIQIGGRKQATDKAHYEGTLSFVRSTAFGNFQLRPESVGGSLSEPIFMNLTGGWFPASKLNYLSLDLSANYKVEVLSERLYAVIGIGVGVSYSSLSVNLRDRNNEYYSFGSSFFFGNVEDLYDMTYETPFEDRRAINAHLFPKFEWELRLSHTLFANFQIKSHFTTSDRLDAIETVNPSFDTSGNDQILLIGIGIVQIF